MARVTAHVVGFLEAQGTILAVQHCGLNSNRPMFDMVQARYLSRSCPSGQQTFCFTK
jgi:hypothetical protein